MLRAGIGHVEGVHPERLVADAIAQASATLEGEPTLGILYAAIDLDAERLANAVGAQLPDTPFIGCSTAAAFTHLRGFGEDSVVIVLLQSDDLAFGIGVGEGLGDKPAVAASCALGEALGGLDGAPKLVICLPDGTSPGLSELLPALTERLGDRCPIVGGAASRHGFRRKKRPWQLCRGKIYRDSAVLLAISGPLEVSVSVNSGWQPVGQETEVTAATGCRVDRIGDRTARDFYTHYLGPHTKPAAEFGLAVREEDTDRFYMRVPIGFASEGGITFGAPVPVGATVQLAEASAGLLLDSARQSGEQAARAYPGSRAALALAFSCNARRGILGSRATREVDRLTGALPMGVPVAGFYGFAEFGPLHETTTSRLHHTTLVTVLLGDGQPASSKSIARRGIHVLTPDEELDFLRRKLRRGVYERADLEETKRANASLLRRIAEEVNEARVALKIEKERSESLLRNILPVAIAERLKSGEKPIADAFRDVTVLFSDIVGFTALADSEAPGQLVELLNELFYAFDELAEQHGLEKIKTIGDAYMVVGGVPEARVDHAQAAAHMALDMRATVRAFSQGRTTPLDVRIGLNSGPVVAGVIGKHKYTYDLWGDTVNVAARMESHAKPGMIQVSTATYELLASDFELTSRGEVDIKGKGAMHTYELVGLPRRR